MLFCNSCGVEMQPTMRTCPACGSIPGLIGGIPSRLVPETLPPTALQTRALYFGRLFALTKIAAGSALALMLTFHSPWLAMLKRSRLEVSAVLSVAIGYGLLKRQIWGLYLLTAAFVLPLLAITMAVERHAPVGLLPSGIIWDLIGVWYFWAHRKYLEE